MVEYYNLKKRNLEPEYDLLTSDFSYVLQSCNVCNAITQRYVPDTYFLTRLYGVWIDDSEELQKFGFVEYKHHIREAMQLTSFLLGHFQLSSPSDLKILDFGAGWGRFSMALRACGCQVYVSDLSSERNDAHLHQGFKVINLTDIQGQDFHFINTEQVLEHMTNPFQVSAKLRSGLRNKGILKISVPYFSWAEKEPILINWTLDQKRENNPRPFHPLEHLTYFRRPSLYYMTKELGMKEVKPSLRNVLDFSFEWTRAQPILKNIARTFPARVFRNYFLFERL